jgi:hypothetical protein
VLDLTAIQLGTGALARVGLEGHHHLVHEGLVVFTSKHGVRRVNAGGGLTLLVQ